MKILLDENIDIGFRKEFPPEHEVFTTEYMGWKGIENGALLKLLEEHGFDCWIGVDKNLRYQQNTENLPCLLVVLDVVRNTPASLRAVLPRLLEILTTAPAKGLIVVPRE